MDILIRIEDVDDYMIPEELDVKEIEQYLRLEPIELETIDCDKIKAIDNLDNIAVNAVWQSIQKAPHILANKCAATTYKVVMPEGLSGKGRLMEYTNGGKSTIVLGDKGIAGHAKLVNATSSVSQIASNVFSVASLVTGTYYMQTISNQLENTNRLLGGVKRWLKNDKKALINANMKILESIYGDCQSGATANVTGRVQQIADQILQNLEFYIGELKDKLEEMDKKRDKSAVVKENILELTDYIKTIKQLYDMLGISYLIEIFYGEEYNVIESRKRRLKQYKEEIEDKMLNIEPSIYQYKKNEKSIKEQIANMDVVGALKGTISDPLKFKGIITLPARLAENSRHNSRDKIKDTLKDVENNIGGYFFEPEQDYIKMLESVQKPVELVVSADKIYRIVTD